MERKIKTVAAYAYDYRGRYETLAYVPEGTVLPPGFTYKQIPLDVHCGEVAQFDLVTNEWIIVEDDWPEIRKHMAIQDGEDGENLQERHSKLVKAGHIPDYDRMKKEHEDKHDALILAVKEHKKAHP